MSLRESNATRLEPFYSPLRTYEENYTKGPFGVFAKAEVYEDRGRARHDVFGHNVFAPFGIPAGPLLNSRFIQGAFNAGFDVAVYKTVRSAEFPCHPFPNVLAVHVKGDLTTAEAQNKPLVVDANFTQPISITNSFGVPSRPVKAWQEDARRAIAYERPGKMVIMSFMGTVRQGQTQADFIEDCVLAGKLASETGAKVLEINLSCPNIGNEGLVCYNLEVTEEIARRLRKVIGKTPLILKVGYYSDDKQLSALAKIADTYAQGIAAINTIQATIVDGEGKPALPGKQRERSGVCGAAIAWAGLETVRRLKALRDTHGYSYSIVGMGGVMHSADYQQYRRAGADVVMSATGAMWNPYLAQEIKETGV